MPKRADLHPIVKGRVLRGFKRHDIGIGLDAGLPQRGNVPFFPGWFLYPCLQGALRLLLVIVQQVIRIVLIRLCTIGAPGLGDACRLLDGHSVPAFRKGGGKERGTYLIRTLIGTEQGNVLLAERQVPLGQGIEGGELARIGRFQPDVGHGSGERLRVVWPPAMVLTLLHVYCFSFEPHRCCTGVVFRVCLAVILWCLGSASFSLLLARTPHCGSVTQCRADSRVLHDWVARLS